MGKIEIVTIKLNCDEGRISFSKTVVRGVVVVGRPCKKLKNSKQKFGESEEEFLESAGIEKDKIWYPFMECGRDRVHRFVLLESFV